MISAEERIKHLNEIRLWQDRYENALEQVKKVSKCCEEALIQNSLLRIRIKGYEEREEMKKSIDIPVIRQEKTTRASGG